MFWKKIWKKIGVSQTNLQENLIGITWKNKQIDLFGSGGSGGHDHFDFYRTKGSSIKDFIL